MGHLAKPTYGRTECTCVHVRTVGGGWVEWGGGWVWLSWTTYWLFWAPKKYRFQGPPLIMAHVMDIAHLKIIMYRAIKITGTLIVITRKLTDWPGFFSLWTLFNTALYAAPRIPLYIGWRWDWTQHCCDFDVGCPNHSARSHPQPAIDPDTCMITLPNAPNKCWSFHLLVHELQGRPYFACSFLSAYRSRICWFCF